MSLLIPIHRSIESPVQEIPLEDIPPADVVVAYRAVEQYGPAVGQERHLGPELAAGAVHETQALLRSVVRHSMTSPPPTEGAAVLFDPDQTLDAKEIGILEEQVNDRMLPETAVVSSVEVRFMAQCLLRQQARGPDKPSRKEAKLALRWLEHNPATHRIVEEAVGPRVWRARHMVRWNGWLTLRAL